MRILFAAKYTEQIMSAQNCFLWIINRNFQMIILFWLVYQLLSIINKSGMFLSPSVAGLVSLLVRELQNQFHSIFGQRVDQPDHLWPETEWTRPWDRLCSFFFSHFLQLANHNHRATRTMIMIMKTRSCSTRRKMSSTCCQWLTTSVQAELTSAFCKTTARLFWRNCSDLWNGRIQPTVCKPWEAGLQQGV